ncbi:MAG: VOC family protein [Armatimonadota bacterium]
MNPQISAVTLGVRDLNRAKQFYSEGLGCPIGQDQGGFVSFNLGNGSSALALYTWDALAADAGVASDGSGFRGITLSYIVPSAERVDEVLAQAKRAGGKIAKPAQRAQWGGYFGYFADPDGYLWKVASAAA